jgi:hypothetical protein
VKPSHSLNNLRDGSEGIIVAFRSQLLKPFSLLLKQQRQLCMRLP